MGNKRQRHKWKREKHLSKKEAELSPDSPRHPDAIERRWKSRIAKWVGGSVALSIAAIVFRYVLTVGAHWSDAVSLKDHFLPATVIPVKPPAPHLDVSPREGTYGPQQGNEIDIPLVVTNATDVEFREQYLVIVTTPGVVSDELLIEPEKHDQLALAVSPGGTAAAYMSLRGMVTSTRNRFEGVMTVGLGTVGAREIIRYKLQLKIPKNQPRTFSAVVSPRKEVSANLVPEFRVIHSCDDIYAVNEETRRTGRTIRTMLVLDQYPDGGSGRLFCPDSGYPYP